MLTGSNSAFADRRNKELEITEKESHGSISNRVSNASFRIETNDGRVFRNRADYYKYMEEVEGIIIDPLAVSLM